MFDAVKAEKYNKTIQNLEPLPKIQPNEIRLTLEGGLIQGIEKGENIPDSITVNLVDFETEDMSLKEIKNQCCLSGNVPCIFSEIV